jgi:DNA-binding PadR family transcriptional regulator
MLTQDTGSGTAAWLQHGKAIRTTSVTRWLSNLAALPALKRLELRLISAKWETSARNRRTKVYKLTLSGADNSGRTFRRDGIVAAVSLVMKPVS